MQNSENKYKQNTNFVWFYVILNSDHKLSRVTLEAPKTRVSQHGLRPKFGSHPYSWVGHETMICSIILQHTFIFVSQLQIIYTDHFSPILQPSLFPTPGVRRQSIWPNLNHNFKKVEKLCPQTIFKLSWEVQWVQRVNIPTFTTYSC